MTHSGKKPRNLRDWFRDFRKQLFLGLLVALALGAIGWGAKATVDYFETRPITLNLDPQSGQASIARFFEIQIRPEFNKYCARPNWQRWIARNVFDQECKRLTFEPHSLESMITRRVPYKETAEPQKLLELFIRRHSGCLTMREDGDMVIISEPETNSQLQRSGNSFLCR